MKPLIAGNWKMNGLAASLLEVEKLGGLMGGRAPADRDVLICPPATLLAALAARAGAYGVFAGGQDCHPAPSGAHTGDISAEMLADAGARFVIVGHSERRADHGETDALARAKAEAALRAGLTPIVCVGETRAQREAGEAEAVVARQLAGSLPQTGVFVVAYEPVWAIGTGLTPTLEDIGAMHAFIRDRAGPEARILYGGSVKPANAAGILAVANVNGALVGGASLKAEDFHAIIAAASP
ncbi:triose-phosphate isomerase [Amphiplicatus metriothermophilus]|uniref:Triosephosphate isomerase n=1 Tax=Amphiplicatus metriothermophilus TaxID=1519374 RepID=A0A239Q0T3_9PROT|nr:triose-phosphate isomerase [Amphiplicatus metriothermophilus]MBB5520056.1 triosephosphate isomerase [Amphiplicatus metriothermophilus]SNT75836.1 triosephosphate isomerase [Amphiplicatus metriothermophilus]